MIMELLHVFFTSVGSITALFFLTKLVGNKQMSQLSMFDYITGISIGSIAAEMATALEDFPKPLLAMVVYALLTAFISYAGCKSIKMRRFMTGESLILLDKGKINEANLKKAKLDVNEFLAQCRINGYFDINDLETSILEPNGRISFLPKSEQRPVKPSDLNLIPPKDRPLINVIIDGVVMTQNLKATGNNEQWLKKQLHAQGISKASDVFLATCDWENQLNIYVKFQKKTHGDMFE